MDIVLNRKGGVPLHDQLLAQLELRILGGSIAPGERLPSVRALARQLGHALQQPGCLDLAPDPIGLGRDPLPGGPIGDLLLL